MKQIEASGLGLASNGRGRCSARYGERLHVESPSATSPALPNHDPPIAASRNAVTSGRRSSDSSRQSDRPTFLVASPRGINSSLASPDCRRRRSPWLLVLAALILILVAGRSSASCVTEIGDQGGQISPANSAPGDAINRGPLWRFSAEKRVIGTSGAASILVDTPNA